MTDKATLREVKTFRAGQIVLKNPDYSYVRINKLLKDEYGSGLRKQYILELIRGIREVKPTQIEVRGLHATAEQRRIYWRWRKSGFIASEARKLTLGHGDTKVDSKAVFGSAPARLARLHRKKWIAMLIKRGWNHKQIRDEIANYYTRGKKRSPWDFIRKEYQPVGKIPIASYRAARDKAREKIKRLYKAYNRRKK